MKAAKIFAKAGRGLALLTYYLVATCLLSEFSIRLFLDRPEYTRLSNGIPIEKLSARAPLSRIFLPGIQIFESLHYRGQEIYQSTYSIDSDSRRRTILPPHERHQHLILFGCSRVFGLGVNDNQTMPFYLGESIPQYSIYNYGVSGGGMNNMLAILEQKPLEREIPESSGLAIYLMYSTPHTKRAIGSWDTFAFGAKNPKYQLLNGKLAGLGSFYESAPVWKKALYYLAKNSILGTLISSSLPTSIDDTDYLLGLAIVQKSAELYRKKFPRGRFVVVAVNPPALVQQKLFNLGIPFIAIPELDSAPENRIPYDGHYSAIGNQKLANSIRSELQKNKLL